MFQQMYDARFEPQTSCLAGGHANHSATATRQNLHEQQEAHILDETSYFRIASTVPKITSYIQKCLINHVQVDNPHSGQFLFRIQYSDMLWFVQNVDLLVMSAMGRAVVSIDTCS